MCTDERQEISMAGSKWKEEIKIMKKGLQSRTTKYKLKETSERKEVDEK